MRVIVFLLLVAVLVAPPDLRAQVIYDIDFETPDQVVGGKLQPGTAPDQVSSILFGQPRVVAAFGALTDQPLLFTSLDQQPLGTGYYYTQIGLSFAGLSFRQLHLDFDLVDVGARHFFTVLFDTPNVRNFVFYEGSISFEHPTRPRQFVGTYPLGAARHYQIQVDLDRNAWAFHQNGNPLATGVFDASGDYVRAIRFNYAAEGPNISGTAIDNLVVTIPEPGGIGWLGLGLGLSLIARQGRKRK